MPSLVLSLTGVTGSDWTVLVNWRMFSIVLSFASFAKSYYSIRSEKNIQVTVLSYFDVCFCFYDVFSQN